MGASIWAGVCGAAAGAELCAPLLLLCWLCCWPDHSSDTSSDNGKHPRKPIVRNESRRRSGESLCRRIGSSAASLHLPSTSGQKQPLSAHRSHEDLPKRASRPSLPDERYHSAPSVIDEVLHRRDWERSSKELYIPLRPPDDIVKAIDKNDSDDSPEAPFAEQESSSIEMLRSEERLSNITCKKHHTNIKRSRSKVNKESRCDLDKDTDASEVMGNNDKAKPDIQVTKYQENRGSKEGDGKTTYKEKETKQSLNESIKSMDRPEKMVLKRLCGSDIERRYQAQITDIDLDSPERSGAEAASPDSRISLLTCVSRELRPTIESDLELDIEGASERPPSYEELASEHIGFAKETAI